VATGVSLLFFPFAAIASLIALVSYIFLWRRALKVRGRIFWWLLSVGSVVFLAALVPGLLFVTIFFVAIYS
jgi:hypothetical protein